MEEKSHKFEKAGLGKAPFRFVGLSQKIFNMGNGYSKSGGTCDYCGTAITNCFHIESSDGKQFYVGSECVRHTGDAGLIKHVKEEESKKRREKTRQKYEASKIEIEALIKDNKEALSSLGHPAIPNKTWLDYAEWMLAHAGQSGTIKLVKRIKNVIEFAKTIDKC